MQSDGKAADLHFFNQPSGVIFDSGIQPPRMIIHLSGPRIMEINADGKHLVINADGTVTGDLPHDKAADEFWKNIAKAFPPICEKDKEPAATPRP